MDDSFTTNEGSRAILGEGWDCGMKGPIPYVLGLALQRFSIAEAFVCTEDVGGKDSMQGSLHSDLTRTKISDFHMFLPVFSVSRWLSHFIVTPARLMYL